MKFSAVILAGGRSSRMGCDKAFVEVAGQTLLARQIQLVHAAGAREVFISGRIEADYSAFDLPILKDSFHDAGPLAGIHSALEAATSPLVLVLAVDLPGLNVDFLRPLAAGCSENIGVVPRSKEHLEPLAAIYPKAALPLAISLLERDSLAVRQFAESCARAGLVIFSELADSAAAFFLNCNSPGELESARRHVIRG